MHKTIANSFEVGGTGLHSGKNTKIKFLLGSNENPSVRFMTDNDTGFPTTIQKISPFIVSDTTLSTDIEICDKNFQRHTISTIEHMMAALWATEISTLDIYVYGNEIPIFDGSSKTWIDYFSRAPLQAINHYCSPIIIEEPITVTHGDSVLEIHPHHKFSADITIDFPYKSIGCQNYKGDLTPDIFKRFLSFCRTFVHIDDVMHLKMMGKALGGSYENAIVVDDTKVLNPNGLRVNDEFVRHKVLDLIGDLWTLGRPIQGKIIGYKPGHTINNMLARKIFNMCKEKEDKLLKDYHDCLFDSTVRIID